MSKNTELPMIPIDLEAAMLDKKRRSAKHLLDQLTQFEESIAADASGDGEFDVELRKSLYTSRACLLRWLAIHSRQGNTCVIEVTDVSV